MKLEDHDFQRLRAYMQEHYGVNLEKKQTMVEGRLASLLAQKGYDSFRDYVEDVLQDRSGDMVNELVTKLTTNYTYFMREEAHYRFLEQTALPEWVAKINNRDLRIWSAGCSSGEEAYTTAMLLSEFFGAYKSDWDTTILATDISSRVLNIARQGIYTGSQFERLPESWKKKYFIAMENDQWRVNDKLKKEVVFGEFNLMDSFSRFKRKFHVIFCRNVMIYFNNQTKSELSRKFYDALEPGGYLFIGQSETLTGINNLFRQLAPAIYKREN